MTEYRRARPEEEDAILDLINLVFSQVSRPHDFAALLPKAYAHPGFSQYHAVAVRDGKLLATAAVLPLRVTEGGMELRGGYLGSVGVHGRERHAGHMRAVIDLLIARAREENYDFLALGGQRQRYGYWGFERCGMGFSFSVTRANARHALSEETGRFYFSPPDSPSHWREIEMLHGRLPFRCERDEKLLPDILTSYFCRPLMILAENGDVAGYLIRQDNAVSEICLKNESDLPAAVRCLLEDAPRITLWVPGYDLARARAVRAFAEDCRMDDCEMLLPLNWERMVNAGLALSAEMNHHGRDGRNFYPDGERIIQIENESVWRFRAKDGRAVFEKCGDPPDISLSRREAVSAFYSASGAFLQPDPLLRAWLPLPWGLSTVDTF